MRSSINAAAVIGSIAFVSTALLTGCGGGSTATPTTAASASAPAVASAEAETPADASAAAVTSVDEPTSESLADGAFPPVADGDVTYQAWNDMTGDGSIALYITNTSAAPLSTESFSLLQSQGLLADGSAVTAGASSCGAAEIPAGDYTTCFLSGFESINEYANLTLLSVSGDGSTVTLPVAPASAGMSMPVWK